MMRASSFLQRFPLLLLAALLVALGVFLAHDTPPAAQAQASTNANLASLTASGGGSAGGAFTGLDLTVPTDVWSATLTAKELTIGGSSDGFGCDNTETGKECSSTSALTDDDFSLGGKDYSFELLHDVPDNSFIVDLTMPAGGVGDDLKALNFCVGKRAFALSGLSDDRNRASFSDTDVGWAADEEVQLSIGASCDPTEYAATVDNSVTYAKLTPTVDDTGKATVQVGPQGGTLNTVTDGQPSAALALNVGANPFTVRVTAEDATTKDYTVTITRQAPGPVTLVSNHGQTQGGYHSTTGFVNAQAFTTGSHALGYVLSAVEAVVEFAPNSSQLATIRAELWSAASGGAPGLKIADLTVPSSISVGTVSFAAPENTVLQSGRSYFFLLYTTGDFDPRIDHVTTGDEDSGAATGWSIADDRYFKRSQLPGDSATWENASSNPLRITVKGNEQVPMAPVWSAVLTVQDLGSGQFGCEPASACATRLTDNDFTLNSNDYQFGIIVQSNSGATFNFIFLSTHSAQIGTDLQALNMCVGSTALGFSAAALTQSNTSATWTSLSLPQWAAGDKVHLSIGNTCPPGQPTGLGATAGAASLALAWTAPTAGTPTGYDVHYTSAPSTGSGAVGDDDAASGNDPSAAWVAVDRGTESDPPAASQSITGLTPGDTYRVRVRATNIGGSVGWVRTTGTPPSTGSDNADLASLTASGGASAGGAFTAFDLTGPTPSTAPVWSATLNVKALTVSTIALGRGCDSRAGFDDATATCELTSTLTEDEFSIGNDSYTITQLSDKDDTFFVKFSPASVSSGLKALNFCVGGRTLSLSGIDSSGVATFTSTDVGWSVGDTVQLSIGATCDLTEYAATVANSVTHAKLTPTVDGPVDATTVAVGPQGGTLTTVVSGSASPALALSVGANAFTVQVTAENGTTKDHTVTITRQPAPPPAPPTVRLSASPNPVDEGSSVTITATLSAARTGAVTVPITVTRNTAESGDHGTLASIAIAANMTTGSGTITTAQDADTHHETFTVALGTPLPTGITAGSPSSVQITIRDDDATVPAAVTGLSVGPGYGSLTLSWTAPLEDVTGYEVHYTTSMTVGADADVVPGHYGLYPETEWVLDPRHSGALGLRPTQTINDLEPEPHRVRVRALNDLGWGPWVEGRGTPMHRKIAVHLSASPNPLVEGGDVTVTATLKIGDLPTILQYDFFIPLQVTRIDSEEGDHGTTHGVTIRKLQRSASVVIPTHRDGDGDDEFFTVSVGNVTEPVRAHDTEGSVRIRIAEREPPRVSLEASPSRVHEGNTVTVTARLSQAMSTDLTLPVTVTRIDSEHDDHWTLSSITVPRGRTTGTGTIATRVDDDTDDERFRVALGSVPLPATAGSPTSLEVTIADQTEPEPEVPTATYGLLSVSPSPAQEGDTVTLTATLENPAPSGGVTATFWIYKESGSSPAGADDYTLSPSTGQSTTFFQDSTPGIRIPQGQRTATATLNITADGTTEGDETLKVHLSVAYPDVQREYYLTLTIKDPDAQSGGQNDPPCDNCGTGGDTGAVAQGQGKYADLIAQMKEWRNDPEWSHQKAHTDRWDRALLAFGETVDDATLTPMTAAEAQGFADRGWERWVPVAAALREMENRAPTVSASIADATIVNESGSHEVSLAGVFDDPDGDALTITAASSDEAVATVSVSSDGSSLTVTAKARGTATVTVTAADGKGGTAEDSFTVTVKAAPVVASAIADVSGLEAGSTQDVSLSGVFSDADGDALTITASSSDEAKATVSVASDGSTLTLGGVAEGTATVTVTAQDSDGNRASDAFEAPVGKYAALIAQMYQWREDPQWRHQKSHTDRWDRALLAFGETVADSSLTPMTAAEAQSWADSGLPRWVPVAAALWEIEGGGQQETPNAAPTVSAAIADATIVNQTGTQTVSLSGVFDDADGDSLTITASSGDEAVATVSVAADQSGLTVTAKARGTATVTVTAADGNGGTAEDAFTVTVKAAPGVASDIADVSGLEAGSTQEVSLSGVFTDADGDALSVTASSSDEGKATVSVSSDGSTLTLTGVAEGTATVTVIAQDSDGNPAMDDFAVTVVAQQQQPPQAPPNRAPTVAAAISDATIVSESGTQTVSLSGVFDDPDGDSLTITAASDDEATATVSVAGDYSSLTVNAQARGTATITVTADDGNGGTVSDAFTVTVKAAPAVASAIADMDLKAGATQDEGGVRDVTLSAVFSDADGDSLTFTADTSDFAIAEALLFQGILTVVGLADGSATITVTAQDADGNTVSDTFDVKVVGPPTPASNLSCVAQTGRVLFSWDAPQWSGAELYAYDYDLTLPDGRREQSRLQGYPAVSGRGEYQAGQQASISVKAVYELADGSEVSSEAVSLSCTVAE